MPDPVVNYTYAARLDRIIDGDTAVLLIDLGFDVATTQHIRFKGYNAPEMHKAHATEGIRAKAELESLLAGKQLVITTTQEFQQTFARYLADVYVIHQTGVESVAEHMIQAGFNVSQGD
jgi:endonuclease YncB( thermonuclease family)